MERLFIKFGVYTLILGFFAKIRLFDDLTWQSVLILAAILAVTNTIVRPVLVTLAFPLNVLTFGIASMFVNLLTLVIANSLAGGLLHGFWMMLLLATMFMFSDDFVSQMRHAIQANKLKEV